MRSRSSLLCAYKSTLLLLPVCNLRLKRPLLALMLQNFVNNSFHSFCPLQPWSATISNLSALKWAVFTCLISLFSVFLVVLLHLFEGCDSTWDVDVTKVLFIVWKGYLLLIFFIIAGACLAMIFWDSCVNERISRAVTSSSWFSVIKLQLRFVFSGFVIFPLTFV